MVELKVDDLARAAYSAYCDAMGGKTIRGETFPEFDDLPEIIRSAWHAAVRSMILETTVS